MSLVLDRRAFVTAIAGLLSGCAAETQQETPRSQTADELALASVYGPILNEPFPIPALDFSLVDPGVLRRQVHFVGHIDPERSSWTFQSGASTWSNQAASPFDMG
jgi:hypothetical protein